MKSKNNIDRHIQHIFEHTKDIFFMKISHCDSNFAKLTIIDNKFFQYFRRINHEILKIFQQKSEIMTKIRQNFHTMLRNRNRNTNKKIAIICFYEKLSIRIIEKIIYI